MALASTQSWRIAWITGASSGIGRDLALQLARAGVKVAASARSADALTALAAQHRGIVPFPLDVTDAVAVAAAVKAIEASVGPIDLAILNAGVWLPMAARDFNGQKAADSMAVNYFGITNAIDALMPLMIARRSGHLAFVSSVAGYRGLPKSAAYSPSKAAVISLSQFLAREWAMKGVRVNTLTPGFFPAEQNRKLLFNDDGTPTARTQAIWGHTPMARFGEARELIGACIFLASRAASSFVTGTDIRVDGGYLSQTI